MLYVKADAMLECSGKHTRNHNWRERKGLVQNNVWQKQAAKESLQVLSTGRIKVF